MSRIEEALEKAAKMRSSDSDAGNQRRPLAPLSVAPSPEHIYPQLKQSEKLTVKNPLVVTATGPHTPVAEEYRKLKSLVVKLTKADNFKNTLMVTSAIASEGKSLTAINLAVSLAQEFDHTVLLVDADLRKPALHKYLGFEPKFGLSECLISGVDVGDALIKTGLGKLSILPHGKPVDNPGELFSSSKMKNLIHELKNRYTDRYIIIDTPPVLLFAETRSISTIVDGIVFVVKEGASSINDVNDALGSIDKKNLLGVVYNQAVNETLNSYYHNYYQHKKYAW